MNRTKAVSLFVGLSLTVSILSCARAQDLAQAGREIASKYGDAVVTLQLVVRTQWSMPGQADEKEESKSEATAAVIDPSGLVVASLAAVDPTELMNRMMAGEDTGGMKVTSEVTDLKIRLADGTEIPAKVVLRDKDLDLAFIRPVKKVDKPLVAIDMSKSTTANLLDQVILMARLGNIANRSLAVSTDRIQSVVEKPRLFYVPGIAAMSSELGAPAFALDGNVIGILLLRSLPGRPTMSSMWMGMSSMGILPVILPASDIVKAAKEVPESAGDASQ